MEKILVIDDEESMCKMVSKSLCCAGYDCRITTVPSKALEMLGGETFDLVVSDIKMPEMDGVQLLRAIRQRRLEVNVILMTAFSDHYSHSDIVSEGADDFIIKPFKLSELKAKIERVDRERQMIRELYELNTTLGTLLRRAEREKESIVAEFMSNFEELVFPYLEKIKRMSSGPQQTQYIDAVESNLRNICSPFRQLAQAHSSLSSTEIQVANLIRAGRRNKEIASVLGLSVNTIMTHRYHLRTKLGLKNKKVTLRTYLNSNHFSDPSDH